MISGVLLWGALIEGARNQDVRLSCWATLGNNCNNAGLVFGYVDGNNFWVKIYSKTQQKCLLYQVSSGTWTQKRSTSVTITKDAAFSMTAEVRAGAADESAATVPAGQVGIWCSNSSDNSFDDFKVRDLAGPFVADGLYFCTTLDSALHRQGRASEVRVDNPNNNVLETYGTDGVEDCIVRRGFRGDKYVATFKFTWNNHSHPGWLGRPALDVLRHVKGG